MKKFINENWFKVAILIISIIAIFIYWNQTQVSNEKQQTLNTPSANINLQEKCAIQANKTFNTFENKYTNDGWDGSGKSASTRTNFNQTNHYNQKENKCYALLTYDFTYAGTLNYHFIDTGESLFDTYGNSELGNCVHAHRLSYDNFPEQYTDTCVIGEKLTSLEKYSELVNQKMELSQ